jgi:hypothetical protein
MDLGLTPLQAINPLARLSTLCPEGEQNVSRLEQCRSCEYPVVQ